MKEQKFFVSKTSLFGGNIFFPAFPPFTNSPLSMEDQALNVCDQKRRTVISECLARSPRNVSFPRRVWSRSCPLSCTPVLTPLSITPARWCSTLVTAIETPGLPPYRFLGGGVDRDKTPFCPVGVRSSRHPSLPPPPLLFFSLQTDYTSRFSPLPFDRSPASNTGADPFLFSRVAYLLPIFRVAHSEMVALLERSDHPLRIIFRSFFRTGHRPFGTRASLLCRFVGRRLD